MKCSNLQEVTKVTLMYLLIFLTLPILLLCRSAEININLIPIGKLLVLFIFEIIIVFDFLIDNRSRYSALTHYSQYFYGKKSFSSFHNLFVSITTKIMNINTSFLFR